MLKDHVQGFIASPTATGRIYRQGYLYGSPTELVETIYSAATNPIHMLEVGHEVFDFLGLEIINNLDPAVIISGDAPPSQWRVIDKSGRVMQHGFLYGAGAVL